MQKFQKFMSYLMVAVLSSALSFAIAAGTAAPEKTTKLEQLENLLLERFIGEADRTALEDGAAEGMVAALGDRWSHYIPAAEYSDYLDQMANSYVGIGITIQATEDNQGFLVVKVNQDGPAEQAGMQAGDIIVAVEGTSVIGLDISETGTLVKGEENTQVSLTVNRNGQELTLTATRMRVNTPVALGKMIGEDIGLITITNFDSRCAEETISAMEELIEQGAGKLIFDVRFNPGGYAHELVKVLDYILPEGDLFRTVDFRGKEDVDTSDAACVEGIAMAVLINGDSYSAAEFFAAALSEYGYAITVGEPTTGKGYFQQTYKLVDGSAVGVSVGKYFTPKGRSLAEEGGLVPDVAVTVDYDTAMAIYAGTLDPELDPQIQAAVAALNP